jgi:GT2 family glycosyltransferase
MTAPGILPVSLIVASRNRAAMLQDSVASILAGTALPAELIIVDQSDVPDQRLVATAAPEGIRLRYLFTAERGLSRANNRGAREAVHETLVFTHDDVAVDPEWLARLTGALMEGGEGTVVTGRILASQEGEGGYAPTLRTGTEPATYRGRIGYDVLKPLNMALHRRDLEAAGWFDERLGPGTPFPGAEDADLGFRLLETGCEIRYVPEALVYHRAWRAEKEYLPLRWTYGVAQGAFLAKHLQRHDLHMARRFVMDALRRARRFPGRCFREPRRALADPLFLCGNLVGAARWVRARGRDREASQP